MCKIFRFTLCSTDLTMIRKNVTVANSTRSFMYAVEENTMEPISTCVEILDCLWSHNVKFPCVMLTYLRYDFAVAI